MGSFQMYYFGQLGLITFKTVSIQFKMLYLFNYYLLIVSHDDFCASSNTKLLIQNSGIGSSYMYARDKYQ